MLLDGLQWQRGTSHVTFVAKGTSKVQTKKTHNMGDEAFADIKQALEDALAFEGGERRELRVTRIEVSRPSKASVKIRQSDKR